MEQPGSHQATGGWAGIGAVAIILFGLVLFAGLGGYLLQKQFVATHRPFAGVSLTDGVLFVTGRKWPLVESVPKGPYLRWLKRSKDGIELTTELERPGEAASDAVTILVHGFHSDEKAIATYFAGTISYLDQLTNRPAGQLIFYDWPSLAERYDPRAVARLQVLENPENAGRGKLINLIAPRLDEAKWENGQYVLDKNMAAAEGVPGLPVLVGTIREKFHPKAINIIAHSMGAWLVLEALKKKVQDLLPIDRVILLAPDAPRNVFDDAQLRAALARVKAVHIYHSRNDKILTYTELGWKEKSLGRVGPVNPRQLPNNVQLHDVTNTLGTKDVHGKYIQFDGANAIHLADALFR